jgi:tRNA threonylcarbamoyladenosine biosynthesis protein TsaB
MQLSQANGISFNMIILTIRTDKPEAEVGLYIDDKQISYDKWLAHRELAESLHQHILKMLEVNNKELKEVEGINVYEGPGSFTGLRIGISVANALAYSLDVPIVGSSSENWKEQGLTNLLTKPINIKPITPNYGASVHITLPRK